MCQFWTSFGQHLCGPEDMWETRFQELLCLKKCLVLSTAPIAHLPWVPVAVMGVTPRGCVHGQPAPRSIPCV